MPFLRPPTAPALPFAERQYSVTYHNQLNNVLRLYFNRINSTFSELLGPLGGRYLSFPYAAVQRTTDQLFTANTVTQITFDQNDFLNGCTNDGTDGIHVENAGVYNYQFSAQWANTAAQIHTAWIWLRINGVDVPGTASKFDVPAKHGASDGYLIAACNFYVQLAAGDYVELFAAVDQAYVPTVSTGLYLEAYPAQTLPFSHPAVPSVVATLTFVSTV